MGSFDEFTKDLNQRPKNTRSSSIDPNANRLQQNNDLRQEHIDWEYITSRQPSNLSAFGRDSAPVLQNPHEPYNSSGRTFNFEDFMADGLQFLQESNHLSYDSDQTLNASAVQQAAIHTYNESGRTFDLSDFRPSTFPESRKYVEKNFKPPDQRTVIDKMSTTLDQADYYDGYHRSLNSLNDDASQRQRLQDSYNGTLSTRTFQEQPRMPLPPTSRPEKCQQIRCPASVGIQRAVCPQRLPECPNLSQDQLVQFLQNGYPSQISVSKPLSGATKNPLFNSLVKDSYYPGAIQDAVDGQINFNKVAFDAVFDGNNIPSQVEPEEVPMTLLEAFDIRIEYERDLQQNIKRKRHQRKQYRTGKEKREIEESEPTFWTHRDELKLASAVDIDLAANIRDQPETGLSRALTSLLKAEKMNDFDKQVHLAEEAIRSASPGKQEKAALRSTCSFKVDLQKDEVKSRKTYTPIEIISYIGTTKPAE